MKNTGPLDSNLMATAEIIKMGSVKTNEMILINYIRKTLNETSLFTHYRKVYLLY